MQGTRFKTQGDARPAKAASSGAHFAKAQPSGKPKQDARPIQPAPAPQVQSIRLPQVVAQTNRQIVTGEFKKVGPASKRRPSPLDSAAIPRVGDDLQDVSPSRRAVITGASGTMTKIPSKSPARKVSGTNRGYSRYSNGYFDRPEARQLTDYVAAFQTEPDAGAPAYSWQAFGVYGALSCVASVAWAAVAMLSGAAPLTGANPLMFAGIVILCCIVVCAFVCAVGTSVATLRAGRYESRDVWASAVGKSALVLLASLVVWIVCAAVVG